MLAVFFAGTSSFSVEAETPAMAVELLQTAGGVEYGMWGVSDSKPAPTLFVLSGTINGTLSNAYYRQCGNQLVERGYMLVSIDIPGHGKQTLEGQPAGLDGWSYRIGKGEDIVAESNERLSKVLDHLIETEVTDPHYIAVCGTSRGGFLAIHFAAYDHRVQCAAGFAPVTNLAALSEFRNEKQHELVLKLSLTNQADRLAGRPVWIMIGDRDDRVGTKSAFGLASRLSAVAREKDIPSQVELHIVSEPQGHTTPKGAPKQAAEWIHRQLIRMEM